MKVKKEVTINESKSENVSVYQTRHDVGKDIGLDHSESESAKEVTTNECKSENGSVYQTRHDISKHIGLDSSLLPLLLLSCSQVHHSHPKHIMILMRVNMFQHLFCLYHPFPVS